MTKTQLSSDLDLVKEIEQLKIKQKLLLKVLKDQEKKEDQEKILESMSAQIQFLVEIFKEVNSNDNKDIGEENKNQTHEISDKINSIKTAIFERLDLLEKKVDLITTNSFQEPIKEEIEKDPETISEEEINDMFKEKDDIASVKEEIKPEDTPPNSIQEEIPKPNFEINEEKKKKGWFSK